MTIKRPHRLSLVAQTGRELTLLEVVAIMWVWGGPVLKTLGWDPDVSRRSVSLDGPWRELTQYVSGSARRLAEQAELEAPVRELLADYGETVGRCDLPDEVARAAGQDFGWYAEVLTGRRRDIERAIARGDFEEIVAQVSTCVPSIARSARIRLRRGTGEAEGFLPDMSSYDGTPLGPMGSGGVPLPDKCNTLVARLIA